MTQSGTVNPAPEVTKKIVAVNKSWMQQPSKVGSLLQTPKCSIVKWKSDMVMLPEVCFDIP